MVSPSAAATVFWIGISLLVIGLGLYAFFLWDYSRLRVHLKDRGTGRVIPTKVRRGEEGFTIDERGYPEHRNIEPDAKKMGTWAGIWFLPDRPLLVVDAQTGEQIDAADAPGDADEKNYWMRVYATLTNSEALYQHAKAQAGWWDQHGTMVMTGLVAITALYAIAQLFG